MAKIMLPNRPKVDDTFRKTIEDIDDKAQIGRPFTADSPDMKSRL